MPIFRGLSKSAEARLQQIDKLLRNIEIVGPDVSAELQADSLTIRVDRPPPTPQRRAAGSLPSGQYQYMSYVMVSQNQTGWDFIRMHPLL